MNAPLAQHMVMADDEYIAVSEGRIRICIGVAVFLIALIIAVIRFASLSLLTDSVSRSRLPQPITTTRADIVDRHGEILATTLNTFSLYAEPGRVWGAEDTAKKLRTVFPDENEADLIAKLSVNKSFVWLRRGLTPKQCQAALNLGLPGLKFRVEPRRVYPRGRLGSHIIGFTDVDMKGTSGVEQAFDADVSKPNASPKALSVDLRMQYVVNEELERGLARFEAISNVGIVLNIKTGEVLAMASLPNFDPNRAGIVSPLFRYNHALMSTYELGSVFKPITMALALETGVTDINEKFPVQNPLRVQKENIKDDHAIPAPVAMPDILAQSSNRGTALMALRAGEVAQQDLLSELGLFDRVPIELGSAPPQLPEIWQDITTVTVSYGHGISVAPLALASAIGALLNDGTYMAPTLAKREQANSPQAGVEGRRVISSKTSQTLRDLMRYVVTDGTGRNAAVEGYSVMGKTGTGNKPIHGRYDASRVVSSFVAAFPYEDPTYLVMVSYDEPKAVAGTLGHKTAGWNAAPTVRKIIERIGPMTDVRRKSEAATQSPFSAVVENKTVVKMVSLNQSPATHNSETPNLVTSNPADQNLSKEGLP